MRIWTSCLFLAAGIATLGCERSGQPSDAPATSATLAARAPIDQASKAGRMFMYLDDGGNVVKTSRYQDIPLAKRSAVMVIEGRTRSRVRAEKEGGITIEALAPKVTASPEEAAGAGDASAILAKHPPAQAGPPSTENWSDSQWREELKRELLELKKEQESEAQPE